MIIRIPRICKVGCLTVKKIQKESGGYRIKLMQTSLVALMSTWSFETMAQDNLSMDDETVLDTVHVIATKDQLKQSLGVSTITADDLAKTPVVNDISEIIRKMPGVNFTGASTSGERGNQRQIDIRGMGPENTLILIDGKPVMSRNAVRLGRSGERDTRGDTSWVPPEAIERIEVIRGPAAARYGSGASGGVVNIITKKPDEFSGSITTFANIPENPEEGKTFRTNFVVGGPIHEKVSLQLIGGYSHRDADDQAINESDSVSDFPAAGREGVINKDISAKLTLMPSMDHEFDVEAGYSRQGNIYTRDSQRAPNGGSQDRLTELAGTETNSMERRTLSLTHEGFYDFGDSLSYIQWENTQNRRLNEGLSGGSEGVIGSDLEFSKITVDNLTAKSEWDLPFHMGFDQNVTLGAEFRGEWMHNPVSIGQEITGASSIPGIPSDPDDRDPDAEAWMQGLYVEDNIMLSDDWMLTPGLRADYQESFGIHYSPSLNTSYQMTEEVAFKLGVARAFKAPNLYQGTPGYLFYSRGNGCAAGYTLSGGCYVVGNEDLEPETSLNKEFGVSFADRDGLAASATYFHNTYKNRISSGQELLGYANAAETVGIFQWENVPEAVVAGFEGNVTYPVTENLSWTTNFTYMTESKNKSDGQPLSLIPKYTVNSWLDWQATDDLNVVFAATRYGKTNAATINGATGAELTNSEPRKPYHMFNIGLKYALNNSFSLSTGINNILNTEILRRASGAQAGANTFNEGSRSYYLSVTATF